MTALRFTQRSHVDDHELLKVVHALAAPSEVWRRSVPPILDNCDTDRFLPSERAAKRATMARATNETKQHLLTPITRLNTAIQPVVTLSTLHTLNAVI